MEHITKYEREQIASLLRLGLSLRAIARKLGRNHTVISREVKRNKGQLFAYESEKAEYFAGRRARKTNTRKLNKNERLRAYVREKLHLGWSPDQIAGRLKNHPPGDLKGATVSHESIYQWIYAESPKGEPWLYHTLRCKHSSRRPHFGRKPHRNQVNLKDIVPIKERPKTTELGHFEADSVVGTNHRAGLSVHYERQCQWARIHLLNSLKAEETKDRLAATILDLPARFVKSFTFDRGSETALHHELRTEYNVKTYHCDPYSPHQKGGVENLNKLIRQYFPKGTDFRLITDDTVAQVEHLLNTRPRKKLQYKTPSEVMGGALNP